MRTFQFGWGGGSLYMQLSPPNRKRRKKLHDTGAAPNTDSEAIPEVHGRLTGIDEQLP